MPTHTPEILAVGGSAFKIENSKLRTDALKRLA